MQGDTAASNTAGLDRFLGLCSAEITRRAEMSEIKGNELRSGAKAFAKALVTAAVVEGGPMTTPVASCLPDIERTPLVDAMLAARSEIPWVASPRLDDGGTEAALAPLNDVRDFGDVICGLLLLGPNGRYPEHSHPPQELYLPLTQGGEWRYGGNDHFETLAPNALIYNHPNDRHAVEAAHAPLLALYVLWP